MLFPRLRFEHPLTGKQIVVHGWSYLFAGLLGPVYVATFRRGSLFLRSLFISAIYGIGTIMVIGASTYLPAVNGVLMLAVMVPAAILAHGRTTIIAIRDYLGRRGWQVVLD